MGRLKRIRLLCVTIVCWFPFLSSISAGNIELSWDGVPNASGYRVYYGTDPGIYTSSITVGNQTEATIQNLTDCTTWYLAVKAYNQAGESAGFSNEISGWPRPHLHSVNPVSAEQGSQFVLSIAGANFKAGARLLLEGGSPLTNINNEPLVMVESFGVDSCNQMHALVTVEPTARGFRAAEVGIHPIGFQIWNPTMVYGARTMDLEIHFDEDRWDINQDDPSTDGRVDGADLSWLAFAYGTFEGEALYNPDADLNGDGMVDGIDLAYLASGFGLCWSGSDWTAEDCG
jgi:hypothetical protein